MAVIEIHEYSDKFKKLLKRYESEVDSDGFPTYQFFEREESMIPVIEKAIKTGVPVEWDLDTCY